MRRPTLAQTGAGIVALVAGYASFRHIVHVAERAGEVDSVAAALPFAVDGLILAATGAMAEDKRDRRAPRWAARVALVAGIGATLAANIASAHPGFVSRAVAAWPALAFLLAVEVLIHRGKKLPDDEHQDDAPGGFRVPPADDEHQDDEHQDDEPKPRRRFRRARGEVRRLVVSHVEQHPEHRDQPDAVAAAVAASVRHVRRILTDLDHPEVTA